MATCRVNWPPLKCRCEIGLEETRRTEEVDRTVQMSSHCRWPRQRGKQETDKLLSWFRRWLEIRTKSLFASRLLGMELLYYNKITAPEELESVSFPKPLRTWRVLLMWISVKNLEDKNLGLHASYISKLVATTTTITRNALWVLRQPTVIAD